jgi:peptidoglycan/xylan/chitin deacetylase (PgdA/CDA1 family)
MGRERFFAIQFLVAGYLGGVNEWDVRKGDVPESLMDASQVRDWIAAGHEIGSHSMTHANLRHLSLDKAREEILGSKKVLEDLFGNPVRHFSFPFGSWNPALRDLVIEAGYTSASTMEFGACDAETSRFELKRIIPLSKCQTFFKIVHRLSHRVMSANSRS